MIKRESLIALGVSLVLGILAVYLANVFLSRNEVQADSVVTGTTKVAVAAVPLDYGVELTPEKIRFVAFPNASLPAGSYRSISDLLPAGKKRIALRPMQPNEPILSSKISGEGQAASIAALLPDGKRAAAVRLNDVSGVAGFVQPNDAVDVLVTRSAGEGSSARQVTDVLLQNIRVIAIDQNAKNADGTPSIAKTATLEVEPIDAQKLALGQQIGSLSLVLRKPGEEQNNPLVETVSLEDLRYSVYGGARYAGGYGQSLAAAFEPARARVSMTQQRPPAPVAVRRTAKPAAARPVRPANSNSVEIVRGTKGEDYVVGGYGS
jgi:pilus assembly protein CpaB